MIARALASRLTAVLRLLMLALVIASPFVVWAMGTLRNLDVKATEYVPASVELISNVPVFQTIDSPIAILVLDLSGSMKKSDPDRQQFVAVNNFLQAYLYMSRGVLGDGEAANVAVVLYSSSARHVSFSDAIWTSLKSAADINLVLERLRPILGAEGDPERRKGWHTDHLAAAKEVGRIAREYRASGHPGSIGVLFMTDGEYDPGPLLDASLAPADLAENRQRFWEGVKRAAARRGKEAVVAAAQESFEHWVEGAAAPLDPADEADAFPIYTLWRTLTERAFGGDRRWYDEAAVNLHRGAGGIGTWFRPDCGLDDRDMFRFVVLGIDEAKSPKGSDVLSVSRAADLSIAFAAVLADWLDLAQSPEQVGNRFVVTPGARALAVVAETGDGPAEGTVDCVGASFPLENGLALAADPPAGPCSAISANPIRSLRAWTDSRYRWVLEVPVRFSILSEHPTVALGLYRTDVAKLVPPSEIYERRPEQVEATVAYADGQSLRVALDWKSDREMYVGKLPLPNSASPGLLTVTAEVSGLQFRGGVPERVQIAKAQTSLEEAWELRMMLRGAGNDPGTAIAGIKSLRLVHGAGMEREGQ